MLLAGIVLGLYGTAGRRDFLAELAEFRQSFGLDSPLVINFGILVITFRLTIKITIASIIGGSGTHHLPVYIIFP